MPLSLKSEALKRDASFFLGLRPFRNKYFSEGSKVSYSEEIGQWVTEFDFSSISEDTPFSYDDEFPTLKELLEKLTLVGVKKPQYGRKYLNRIGVAGQGHGDTFLRPSRELKYFIQRHFTQGFSDRELWNFDYGSIELMYERLYRFREITHVDFFHEYALVDFKGEKRLIGDLINEAIEIAEKIIVDPFPGDEKTEGELLDLQRDFWEVFSVIAPHLVD